MYVVKTKALISCPLTMQLICAFVFAYAKSRFSHDPTHYNCVSFSIIATALMGTSLIFVSFTLASLYNRNRTFLYMGGKSVV